MESEHGRGSIRHDLLTALAVLAIGSSLAATPGLDIASKSAEATPPPVLAPDWLNISQCNTNCQIQHLDHGDVRGYNTCYACDCLVGAAENEGELVAAMAQCQHAARASW